MRRCGRNLYTPVRRGGPMTELISLNARNLYPCPQGRAGCARGAMRQDRPDFPE